jgi:hypothetical protein
MNALRALSKILILIPIVMLAYDAVKGWFVDAHVRIRPLQEWWRWVDAGSLASARPALAKVMDAHHIDSLLQAPGPVVMLIPPVVLYVLYRVIFAVRGERTGGYRSRD